MSSSILHTFYGRIRDTTRLINEARSLVEMGYNVTAIGAAREGLPAEPATETIDGVGAVLVPLILRLWPQDILMALWRWLRGKIPETAEQMPPGNKLRTLLNVILYNLWLLRIGGRYKPQLIHCHEIYAFPGSWLLAKRYRIPLVYDAWEPTYFVDGSGYVHRLLRRYQRWIARHCDALIITAGYLEPVARDLTERPISLIGNWKLAGEYDVPSKTQQTIHQKHQLQRYRLIVSYIGFLFEHREIRPLLNAIAATPDVALLIAGRGPLREEVIEASQRSENIIWLDWLTQTEVSYYTVLSDCIYCCVPDTPEFQRFLPNKFFEAITTGRAMIVHAGVGEMADIVEKHQMGILVPEVTTESIQQALIQLQDTALLDTLKTNARALYKDYNWEIAEKRLAALYEELITPS